MQEIHMASCDSPLFTIVDIHDVSHMGNKYYLLFFKIGGNPTSISFENRIGD